MNAEPVQVAGCLCFGVSFRDLIDRARTSGADLRDLHAQTRCGGKCGLCVPYIQIALATGIDSLPVLWRDDFARLGIAPGAVGTLQRTIEIRGQPIAPRADEAQLGPIADALAKNKS